MLFKALAVFALRDINLTKVIFLIANIFPPLNCVQKTNFFFFLTNFQIESRPQRKRPLRVVDDSNKGSARLVLTFLMKVCKLWCWTWAKLLFISGKSNHFKMNDLEKPSNKIEKENNTRTRYGEIGS